MAVIKTRQGLVRIGLLVLALAALGGAVFFLTRGSGAQANGTEKAGIDEPTAPGEAEITVKSVRPRRDSSFQMTAERPANVEAYHRVKVEAEVAGQVKSIRVAPGSRVKKGQTLVKLNVPDLEATLAEKQNIVEQRKKEHEVALAKAEQAEVAVHTAEENIKRKDTLLAQAEAVTVYRRQGYNRLRRLRSEGPAAVDQDVVDEAYKNVSVARAGEDAAKAEVSMARAEVKDAEAALKSARADAELKKQLVHVAEADLKRAQVQVEFANIKAPFDGTVVSRKVHPGSFVQNASTGNPTPLLELQRTDIVTVVMRLPDIYAPFINAGTEAVIELDALPGLKIHGKVTRYSGSLVSESHDKTMRVDVDLWNDDPARFQAFMASAENREDLKEGLPPLVPQITGKNALKRSTRLMPGMYGKMTLILHTFGDTYLIPSQAIIREAGRPYLYVVKNGKAHLTAIAVQVDDGKLAKVERLGNSGEVLGDLEGDEEIIVSNLEEMSEGQAVKTTPLEDWKALEKKAVAGGH